MDRCRRQVRGGGEPGGLCAPRGLGGNRLYPDQSEYMFLFTADGFTGEPHNCDEGELAWVDKKDIENLELWEGDKIFFRLLEQEEPFFSLKLIYEGNVLKEAVLNGKTNLLCR